MLVTVLALALTAAAQSLQIGARRRRRLASSKFIQVWDSLRLPSFTCRTTALAFAILASLGAQSPPAPKDQFQPYLPQYLVTAGGGAVVPGHGGSFAYQCFGALMGQATYALSCQQYTLVKGQLQNCALAGLTKVTHHFGPVSFGVTGLGGGCESTNGNADPAGNAQVFASFHIGHTPLSIPVTLEKTFSAVGKQEAKITAGLIWGFGK